MLNISVFSGNKQHNVAAATQTQRVGKIIKEYVGPYVSPYVGPYGHRLMTQGHLRIWRVACKTHMGPQET